MLEFLLQLDKELFLFLNGLHADWLDPVMYYISDKYVWIPFYALLLYFCWKHYGKRVFLVMVMAALLITLSDQISVFMKFYFERFRPTQEPDLEGMVHTVFGKRGGKFGFVSSHAANSFALATFMILILKDKFRYITTVMLTFAILNSYSRIYLGVHYPGDVIGGALLGIAIGWIVFILWQLIHKKFFPKHYTKKTSWI